MLAVATMNAYKVKVIRYHQKAKSTHQGAANVDELDGGTFLIRNRDDGRVFTVDGNPSTRTNTKVILSSQKEAGKQNQLWRRQEVTDGWFRLVPVIDSNVALTARKLGPFRHLVVTKIQPDAKSQQFKLNGESLSSAQYPGNAIMVRRLKEGAMVQLAYDRGAKGVSLQLSFVPE